MFPAQEEFDRGGLTARLAALVIGPSAPRCASLFPQYPIARAGPGRQVTMIPTQPATRADYERCAFLLIRHGRLPGLELAHLDFRVLLFLLGQRPGVFAAHQRTIAAACDSNVTSVRLALGRLRAVGLVRWRIIPPHHALPSGRYARTNVCLYEVDALRLATRLAPGGVRVQSIPGGDAGARGEGGAADRIAVVDPPVEDAPADEDGRTGVIVRTADLAAEFGAAVPAEGDNLHGRRVPQDPSVSTQPDSDASSCTDLGSEQKPSPGPSSPAVCAGRLGIPREEGVIFEKVWEAWVALDLGPPLDGRAVRALRNRLAEGAAPADLHAAVEGAGEDDWLRRRAAAPFAVVFASVDSVRRFAGAGRQARAARAAAALRAAAERAKDQEWQSWRAGVTAPPPEARAWLPARVAPSASAAPDEQARRREAQLAELARWAAG